MGLITKSDCMCATDLNHAVRHLCHVVDVCFKLLKDFHDYCLFNMSDQKSWEFFLVVFGGETTKT